MKRQLLPFLIILLVTYLLTSCMTVLNGEASHYQKTKPSHGEPKREISTKSFITSAMFPPGILVDFLTGAIYRDEPKVFHYQMLDTNVFVPESAILVDTNYYDKLREDYGKDSLTEDLILTD